MDRWGKKGRIAGVSLAMLMLSSTAPPAHASRGSSSSSAALASPPAATDQNIPAPPAAPLTVAGMVFRMDPETPRLEVLTGVGLALRVLRIRCDESTLIQEAGKQVRLASLKRGDPVRVTCRPSVEGYVAIRIEVLPRPRAEGETP